MLCDSASPDTILSRKVGGIPVGLATIFAGQSRTNLQKFAGALYRAYYPYETPHPPIPQYPPGFLARYCW